MAVPGIEKLAGLIADVARPLTDLYDDDSKKQADASAGRADGQTRFGAPKKQPVLPQVACAASVAQVVRLEAEPALSWDGARGAWRCAADDTRVTVRFADGTAEDHLYATDTLIRVAAGLIHFPASRR